MFFLLFALSGALQAPALLIEADAPVRYSDGSLIPPETAALLRGTLFMKPAAAAQWQIVSKTTDSIFRWRVDGLAPGTWHIRVTAQILDLPETVSALSDLLVCEIPEMPDAPGGLSDRDGDGMLDLHEQIAGTSPTDPSSVLALTCVIRTGGKRELSWFGVTGRLYKIEYAPRPDAAVWQTFSTELAGANKTLVFTDAEKAPVRYYRIQVRQAVN